MLNRFPPRVSLFLRSVTYSLVAYLATVGALALYHGSPKLDPYLLIALIVGGGFGVWTENIPGASNWTSEVPASK